MEELLFMLVKHVGVTGYQANRIANAILAGIDAYTIASIVTGVGSIVFVFAWLIKNGAKNWGKKKLVWY